MQRCLVTCILTIFLSFALTVPPILATPFFSLPMPAPFQFSLSGGSAISTSTLLETSRAVAQALPVNLSVAGTEHNSATSSRNRQMTGDQPLPVVRDGGIVSIAAGCPYGYSDVDCSGIDRAYLRLEAGADETALNHAIEIAIGDADNQACWGGCVIDLRELGELTLTGSLDMIPSFGHNIWLLGDPGNTKINGNQYQILSINDSDVNGFLAFFGVEFTNGSVWGGNGSEGGGGGLGAGGALFINQGSVIIDHSKFSNNLARGGDSIGTAPKAPDSKGDGYTNTGEGGRFNYGNNGQKAQFHPFMGGDGGGGGIRGSGGAGRNGKKGNRGQWGSGGGGGGSGSSADSGGSDAGGCGGRGGLGGWGGGGGGGAGGGRDKDKAGSDEPGYGGPGGYGGPYNPEPGDPSDNDGGQCSFPESSVQQALGGAGVGGAKGGTNYGGAGSGGGGGAGLGGAIFVRDGAGDANSLPADGGKTSSYLAIINSEFSGNRVEEGTGNQDTSVQKGKNLGANFYFESYASGQYGSSGNYFPTDNGAEGNQNQITVGTNNTDTQDLIWDTRDWPSLSLSLVGLDGDPIDGNRVYEGERANLKISFTKSFSKDTQVYFYLSKRDAFAEAGVGNNDHDPGDINSQQGKDFAWGSKIFYKFTAPQGQAEFYLTIPQPDGTWTNARGAYSGIQTYIDKLLEGDEDFSVTLLPGPGYTLDKDNYFQEIIIEDINYQVEILTGQGSQHTAICDAADALEPAADDPATDCNIPPADNQREISIDNLKGLGYTRVQVKRPVNFYRASKDDLTLPEGWDTNEEQYTTFVNGDFFNNALAGGLPVHYSITGGAGVDYFANQLNYNNDKYEELDGDALENFDRAQVFNAVVIPVTEQGQDDGDGELPPGMARLYFAALPDAIKEEAKDYTLTLNTFPNDPVYDPDNFCPDGGRDCDSVLENTPDGNYQFYTLKEDAIEAIFTIHDSNEFIPAIIIADNINREPVNDPDNPLILNEDGSASFWVKLASQPTAEVTLNGETDINLTFSEINWHQYQEVELEADGWGESIDVNASSAADPNYNNVAAVNRSLIPISAAEATKLKITEGNNPDVSQRTVTLNVTPSMDTYTEGGPDMPGFVMTLGQPLPRDIVVTYDIDQDTDQTLILPAYYRSAGITYPVADDNTVAADRTVNITLTAVSDPGVTFVDGGDIASFTIRDNDKATVLISQHQPEKPGEGDVVILVSELEIIGIKAGGTDELVVQNLASPIKDMVIVPVSEGVPMDVRQGLVKETAPMVEQDDLIEFPDALLEAEIIDTPNPLTDVEIAANMAVRLRGLLSVEEEGDYRFTLNPDSDVKVEFWLNPVDAYSQNKGMAVPVLDAGGQVVDATMSGTYPLEPGREYYIEALAESTNGGSFSITWQKEQEEDIPLERLKHTGLDSGFVVETWVGIDAHSIDQFVNSATYQGDPDNTKILTSTLDIPQNEAVGIGRRISAVLTVPETGDYVFALASDGDSQLTLLGEGLDGAVLANIDGDEIYGKVDIETGIIDSQYTGTQFSLQRYDSSVGENSWVVDYEMGENKETLPFGANGKITILETMNNGTNQCYTDNDSFVQSEVVGFYGSGDPAPSNRLNITTPLFVKPPNEDLINCEDYSGYNGTEISFIFQDLVGGLNAGDYTNFTIDGYSLDALPDFPTEHQWDWDTDDEGSDAQQNSKQVSDPVYLKQGEQYALEVLQVNSVGEGHLSLAWQPPSATGLTLLPADQLSFPRVSVPIRLLASNVASVGELVTAEIALSASPVSLFGKEYRIRSVTLEGDPGLDDDLDGVTPYRAPGYLAFASGFNGTLNREVVIGTTPVAVTLTPMDTPNDPGSVNLTVGQQQRLGFQLQGQPDGQTTVTVSLSEQGPGTDPDNATQIQLSCGEIPGGDCDTFEFDADNWNKPQYITVEALSEGLNGQGLYDPALSYIDLVTDSGTVFAEDVIRVQVFPDSLENYTVYFVNPQGETITDVSFTVDSSADVQVTYQSDSDSEPLDWYWVFEAGQNGEELVAYIIQGGDELVRLLPALEWQSGDDISDNEPVTYTTEAIVSSELLKMEAWRNGVINISGITLQAVGSTTPVAEVMVTLTNGLPTIEVLSQVLGEDDGLTDPETFSYIPQRAASPIQAVIGETLITEFGELRVYDQDGYAAWSFEPNPRPQSVNPLPFRVDDSPQEIDLSSYSGQSSITTSFGALPDASQPLATLAVDVSDVTEETATVTVTVSLDTEVTDPEGTRVYYSVDAAGVNDPGNIALNLPETDDYALELGNGELSLNSAGLTVEIWIRPTDLSATQGLLLGSDGMEGGTELSLLSLDDRTITVGSFNEGLPTRIEVGDWFHLAYTASAEDQVLYLNGEKLATEAATATLPAFLKAIGRDESTNYFKGAIDDVRIWDQVRTELQIRESYASALATGDADVTDALTGYWDFNRFDLANRVDEDMTGELLADDGPADIQEPIFWQVRQSAVEGEDYLPLGGFVENQPNFFNLDVAQTGGRTTFAIADFDGDDLPDAAILNARGELDLHLNRGTKGDGKPVFEVRRQGVNLSDAMPISAGDMDGDGDIDIIAGGDDGKLHFIENVGDRRTARFVPSAQPLADDAVLKMAGAVSPTLADIDGDGLLELVTISSTGQMIRFNIRRERGRTELLRNDAIRLPGVPKLEQEQGYFVQFLDLDQDGDQDALVDVVRNQPGQIPGAYRYFENYGSSERPFYTAAPRSRIARYLRHLDREVTYGGKQIRHPYDQVEFYQFADWDGDGDLDLFQSDTRGLIGLHEAQGFKFVTILQGQTETTFEINLTDDPQAETTEFIQLRIIEGNVATADYHTEMGSDRIIIEIEDNDAVGVKVYAGTALASELPLNDPGERVAVSETADPALYQVQLSSRPAADVQLKIASSNPQMGGLVAKGVVASPPSEGAFKDAITLKFSGDGDDWQTLQSFWLKGVDDLVDDEAAPFSYIFLTNSADPNYRNVVNALPATSSENDDTAAINLAFDSLPEAAIVGDSVQTTEGQINTIKVALNSQPTEPVTLILAPEDRQLTFFPQRRIVKLVDIDATTRRVKTVVALPSGSGDCTVEAASDGTLMQGKYGKLCWREDGQYSYIQIKPALVEGAVEDFSYVIDNGYGRLGNDSLSIVLSGGSESGSWPGLEILDHTGGERIPECNPVMPPIAVEGNAFNQCNQALIETSGDNGVIFGVKLMGQLADDESVVVRIPGVTDASDAAPLIFDSTNWNIYQEVQKIEVTAGEQLTISSEIQNAIDPGFSVGEVPYAEDRILNLVEVLNPHLIVKDNLSGEVFLDQQGYNNLWRDGENRIRFSVKLGSGPSEDVTLDIKDEAGVELMDSLEFTAGNWNVYQPVDLVNADISSLNISSSVDTGQYTPRRDFWLQDGSLISQQGNLFFNANSLAGQSMNMTFTPEDWNLERTLVVAAVDDDLVEYHHHSQINLLLADPGQPVVGNYGMLRWNTDGSYTYILQPDLAVGTYQEQPLFYVLEGDQQNHILTLGIMAADTDEDIDYSVVARIDSGAGESLDDIDNPGQFPGQLGGTLTGVSLDTLDAVYLAQLVEPIRVSIEDNDMPIVRAGIDLNAGENTHPGYFTLSVMEDVGYPSGLPVRYKIYGFSSNDDSHGATAETEDPEDPPALQDPGPDFQGYDIDTLMSGTLYIPNGKKRVSFPIFPIDDFTPEESLAARYEKVVVEIQWNAAGDDRYVLDQVYPETQTAAVRILDNEKVGLKVVIPADGLAISEGEFNGFRVGLKSQPQHPVNLHFYYRDVLYDNRRDRSFLEVSSATFSTNDWNQWKTVDVRLFNNLVNNDDDLHPRYTDLYFTLLDKESGCTDDPTSPDMCEPFYNTMKGALNLTVPGVDDNPNEPKTIDDATVRLTGGNEYDQESDYGKLTLTPIRGSTDYMGDFVYRLRDGSYDTAGDDQTESILTAIANSGVGRIYDVFDYTMNEGENPISQKVAVEIQALNSIEFTGDGTTFPAGDYGTLTLDADNTYTYTFDPGSLLPSEENWTLSDSFVYRLETTDSDGDTTNGYSLNIDISKDTDTDTGAVSYAAIVNGNSPDVCEAGDLGTTDDDLTVCPGTGAGTQTLSGSLTPDTIGGDDSGADITQPVVTAYGRPTLVPVVTNMYLRGDNDRDLWVGPGRIVTNPLFKANAINSVEDLQWIDPEESMGEVVGEYGRLQLTPDGSYTYELDKEALQQGLDDVDERVVHDRFRYLLDDGRDKILELVTVYKKEQDRDQTIVHADGVALTTEDETAFDGRLIYQTGGFDFDWDPEADDPPEIEDVFVDRVGPAHASVYLREQPLDPFVVAEGLSTALNFLQARFYDASVPIMGRMGGGPTGNTSGDASDANAPSFVDRIVNIVENEITKQPHLTPSVLENIFKKALQATFGEFGIPLQVLKLDSEKLLMKLSFTAGVSSKTDEYETDWGMPGMGHFAGSAEGTFKFTLDLVFGIKFRSYDGSGPARPSLFVVTDQTALDSLMGSPTSQPQILYDLQTWEGTSVAQNGIIFLDKMGKRPSGEDPEAADNTKQINDGLLAWSGGPTNPAYTPQIRWEWKTENPKNSWEPETSDGRDPHAPRYDYGAIVGIVYPARDDILATDAEAPFIEISLRQPTGIGPNKNTPVLINAILDPENLLISSNPANQWKKQSVEYALDYLSSGNKDLEFKNRLIQAIDINDNANKDSKRGSQPLKASFDIAIKTKKGSTLFGDGGNSYQATFKKVSVTHDLETVLADRILLPASSTHKEQQKSVMTNCRTSTANRCKPDQLDVTATWVNGRSTTRKFPKDLNVFKTRKTWSDTLQLEEGDLKITGTYKASKIEWTWQFSALASESIGGFQNNIKAVDNITLQGNDTETLRYAISKYKLMFLDDATRQQDPKYAAISKISLDLSAAVDFQGKMQIFVLGASVNQAVMPPLKAADTTQTEPAKVYQELVGKYSDRARMIDFAEGSLDTPNYIAGDYGVLALSQDGSYDYFLKEDMTVADGATYDLTCREDRETTLPGTPQEAAYDQICSELLKINSETGDPEYWADQTLPQDGIEFKGYAINCPVYSDVANGGGVCQVSSPNILMSPISSEELELTGVPSLETAIDVAGGGIPGWESSPNLVNRISMRELYTRIKTSGTEDTYGIPVLKDTFYISTRNDVSFRKLEFVLGSPNDGDELTATFNGVDFSGFDPVDSDDDAAVDSWQGGSLSYHEPGIGEPLQAGPGIIQPMAKARVFLDIALKDPDPLGAGGSQDPHGMVYRADLLGGKGIIQYTLGGDAALYAQINTSPPTPPALGGDVDDETGFELPLPSVMANLGLIAHYQGTTDFADVSSRGGEFIFGLYNMGLDLGSLLSDQLVEPLSHMSNEMEPIRPIANALTADMKIFSKINLEHIFDSNNDGRVTVLEIPTPFLGEQGSPKAQRYAKQLKNINKVLEFIAGIFQMIEIAADLGDELSGVKALKERVVSLDGYVVSPEDIRVTPYQDKSDLPGTDISLVPYVNQMGHIIIGSDANYQFTKTLTGRVEAATVKKTDPDRSDRPSSSNPKPNKSMGKTKQRFNELRDQGVISFPILSSPLDMIKLVFGDPADLIFISVPDMALDFEVNKKWRPPPVPIFIGKIAGSLQIGTDIDVGVDTGGLLQAICGSNTPGRIWDCQGELSAGERSIRLLNGIYVRDWSEESYSAGGDGPAADFWKGKERDLPDKTIWDKHELFGNAEIDIGAGIDLVVFGATFQGGPGLGGGVDMVDICEATTPEACDPIQNGDFSAGSYYDGKLRAYDMVMQLINDAKSVFDVGFTFYVDFEAMIESFGLTLWEQTIGYFPLYQFDLDGVQWVGGGASRGMGSLVGGTVFFDANGNGKPDAGEPVTFTDSHGRSSFNMPYLFFDKNADDLIDERDGLIRMVGGVDVETGESLHAPLASLPQAKVISSLTTLVAHMVNQGIPLAEAQVKMRNVFRLPEDIDLLHFNPLKTKGNKRLARRVMVAQEKAAILIDASAQLRASLTGRLSQDSYAETLPQLALDLAAQSETLNLDKPEDLEKLLGTPGAGEQADSNRLTQLADYLADRFHDMSFSTNFWAWLRELFVWLGDLFGLGASRIEASHTQRELSGDLQNLLADRELEMGET